MTWQGDIVAKALHSRFSPPQPEPDDLNDWCKQSNVTPNTSEASFC